MTDFRVGDKVTVSAGSRNCQSPNTESGVAEGIVGAVDGEDCDCIWVIPETHASFLVEPEYLTHRFEVGDKVDVAADSWANFLPNSEQIIKSSFEYARTDTVCGVEPGGNLWFTNGGVALPRYVTPHREVVSQQDEADMVNNPAHYSQGMPEGVEVVDVLNAQGWADNAYMFNAGKYILRCEHKGKKVQDIKKAMVFLQWELDRIELDDDDV